MKFDKEYKNMPIVAANMVFDEEKNAQDQLIDPKEKDRRIAALGVSYFVSSRNKNSFVIVLSKPASEDMNFSWIAFAVDDPNKFEGGEQVILGNDLIQQGATSSATIN
ncbi:hypothetical protein HY024_00310 [Candidatus Curtissbacteria bacterium]|nr:hypothetical protein [Candidatus Curtissbacteria bacterium]